ncbi:MAG: C4-type zinc ribbon domain-containing protein [Candidatus Rokuibacteriota bacterium]
MDQKLQTLINLQAIDSRIAALEADAARLPKEIAAIHAAVEDAKTQVEQTRARLDTARKDQRAKEKDLEVVQAKRTKNEARLYEVKTNKEYSAVLIEIEDIKQEKARMEEEVLVLMEAQERLTGDIREAEARFKQRETEGRSQEATAKEQLRVVETELAAVRTERKELAGQLPGPILGDYDRILRARGGVALAPVAKPNFCGACRMTITPQRLQELRAQSSLIPCESCGRYLYWPS